MSRKSTRRSSPPLPFQLPQQLDDLLPLVFAQFPGFLRQVGHERRHVSAEHVADKFPLLDQPPQEFEASFRAGIDVSSVFSGPRRLRWPLRHSRTSTLRIVVRPTPSLAAKCSATCRTVAGPLCWTYSSTLNSARPIPTGFAMLNVPF